MIRLIITVVLCLATAALAVWLAANPGAVSFEFLGWQGETTAAVMIALLAVAAFALAILWWLLAKLWGAPGAIVRANRRRRRDQGVDALERALIAAAAGEGDLAVRQAARAEALMKRPVLSRIMAARAAEAAGDLLSAQHHYEALLTNPRTKIVARRGLSLLAEARGEPATVITHASDVFGEFKTARWAFDSLFNAQIAEGRWEDALTTLDAGEKRRHVTEEIAARRRAVLMTVLAGRREGSEPEEAAKLAEKAVSASPGFAPAAVLAARLTAAKGKPKRASDMLQSAWALAPHPALARAYRDLKADEPRAKRAERMLGLAALNPHHRESKLLLAELALEQGNARDARALITPMIDHPEASARVCALAARLAKIEGDEPALRRHLARAAHAPVEPDWSDLDGKGRPFAFSDADWKRMVFAWGDEARLIHPRHERYEIAAEAVPEAMLLEAPKAAAPPPAAPETKGAPEPPKPETPPATAPAPPPPPAAPQPQRREDKPAPGFYETGRPPDDPGVSGDDRL